MKLNKFMPLLTPPPVDMGEPIVLGKGSIIGRPFFKFVSSLSTFLS
jgi:hypothetical protein